MNFTPKRTVRATAVCARTHARTHLPGERGSRLRCMHIASCTWLLALHAVMSGGKTETEHVRTAPSLLLQAVESLDDRQVENEGRRLHPGRESSSAVRPPPGQPPTTLDQQGPSTMLTERNRLFNFGFCCRNSSKAALNLPTKSKKKLHSTWCHNFVCLPQRSRLHR